MCIRRMRVLSSFLTASALATVLGAHRSASAAEFITYFLPTPIYDKLETGVWGAAGVLPREQHNGLEDLTLSNWVYWDGKIIKGPDGKYHLFGSKWAQSTGHAGYYNSVCVHATSDNPTGPYTEQGLCYPNNQSGKGHNVTAIAMHDGRYAILVSDTRPGDLFIASSLDGPWVYQGRVQIDTNGFTTTRLTDNMSIMLRPDGRYMIVPLGGFVMISDSGIMGPYKVVTNNIFPQNVAGYPSATREDPVVWYSGCQYHVVVDDYNDRKGMHLTSPDGLTWTYKDLAYSPTADFVRYADGTVNHWYKLERMGVLLDGGHVKHFTFAAIDVEKTQALGNDQHGSKIIVVPFDGEKFDAETGLAGCQTPGSGGATGSGGASGVGGTKATGGSTAAGGTSSSSGGTSGRGGSGNGGVTQIGSGGSSVGAGGSSSGGSKASAGGTTNAGGRNANGGNVSVGGDASTAGGVANLGSGGSNANVPGGSSGMASGGALAAGGSVGTSSGGTSAASVMGGSTVVGTMVPAGGATSTVHTGVPPAGSEESGCSCKITSGKNGGAGARRGLALLSLALLMTRLRRSRARRPWMRGTASNRRGQ